MKMSFVDVFQMFEGSDSVCFACLSCGIRILFVIC